MRRIKEIWPTKWAYRLIALGLLLLIASSTAVIIVDRIFVTDEPVAPIPQDGRFIAVGTQRPDSFKRLSPLIEPLFGICASSTDVWRLSFSWVIQVADNAESFIKTAPPIYLAGPPDMFDLRSERPVAFESSGSVERLSSDLSTFEVIGGNSLYKLVAIRPKVVHVQPFGRREAYYGLRFYTRHIDVGTYGLGVRGFNITYLPDLISSNDLSPGVGKTSTPQSGGGSALRISSCRSPFMKDYKFREDDFVPAPSEVGPQRHFTWYLSAESPLTITGVVYGGPGYMLRKVSGWFLTTSLAALIGMLYVAAAGQPDRADKSQRRQRTPQAPTSAITGSASNHKRRRKVDRKSRKRNRRRRR
jgi:hypothetical protein